MSFGRRALGAAADLAYVRLGGEEHTLRRVVPAMGEDAMATTTADPIEPALAEPAAAPTKGSERIGALDFVRG